MEDVGIAGAVVAFLINIIYCSVSYFVIMLKVHMDNDTSEIDIGDIKETEQLSPQKAAREDVPREMGQPDGSMECMGVKQVTCDREITWY